MNRIIQLALLFLCVTASRAQHTLDIEVFSNCAYSASSSNYQLTGTVGQAVVGPCSATDGGGVDIGFWYCVKEAPKYFIEITPGWNLISYNAEMTNMALDEVFMPLINSGSYFCLYDFEGGFDAPAFNISDIPLLASAKAYRLYCAQSDTLPVTGFSINPASEPISLQAGWNIIPFLGDKPSEPEQALSSIMENIVIVHDQNGGFFIPSESVNTLESAALVPGMLIPGRGYLVYVSQPCTLVYP